MTAKVIYNGDLRTTATHIKSGQTIITDAPVDNQGKGEAFSPTDLLSTSLASCLITVMGIMCQSHGINIDGAEVEVVKIMSANPRKVSQIDITIKMPNISYSAKDKKMLIHTAKTCPVSLSLHPDIDQNLKFIWQ